MTAAVGLFEAHLTVADLDRSVAFYRDAVGLEVALELDSRGAAFLWVGAPGEAMLGLWSLGSAPVGLSLHIALKASLADVLGACDALGSAASRRCRSSARRPANRASSAGCRRRPSTSGIPTGT
jgi:catechol 2,3-dioxygenase-like lactoylglutathione lyase family enzyme